MYGYLDINTLSLKQMVTQKGNNVNVTGVNGNFDDAQTGVKKIFTDKAIAEKLAANSMAFSSANSINYGYVHGEVFGMAVGILNLASVTYLAYKYYKHTND